jgi:predicted enzyme related to lactoylglutathione lyase
MAHPVTWFQISGKQGGPLHTFYKKVFGWRMRPAPGPGDMQMIDKEEDGISGGIGA